MKLSEILQVSAAILASLGGAAAIILGFSSWLGKIWAERIVADAKAKHESVLAELRTNLDIYKSAYLKQHDDKLNSYRQAIDVVTDFLADLNLAQVGHRPEGNALDRFNRGRLKAHGYLAMLAPQEVMDAYDSLIDYIFTIIETSDRTKAREQWKEVRRLAYALLNSVREDIGIDKSKIEYRGKR